MNRITLKTGLVSAAMSSLVLLGIGQAQAQTCHDSLNPTTGDHEFDRHTDGTVTHKRTGLMWKMCAEGQTWENNTCTGEASTLTWGEAMQYLNSTDNQGYANYTNWRVPNIKELKSIAELSCYGPAINLTAFPNSGESDFWSASLSSREEKRMSWIVNFEDGEGRTQLRFNLNNLRLVRDVPAE